MAKRELLRERWIERDKEKLKDVETEWRIELQRLVNFCRLDFSARRIRLRKRTNNRSSRRSRSPMSPQKLEGFEESARDEENVWECFELNYDFRLDRMFQRAAIMGFIATS